MDPVDSPEILDDFELPQQEAVDIKDMQVNQLKLTRRINHFKVVATAIIQFQFHFFRCLFIYLQCCYNYNVG